MARFLRRLRYAGRRRATNLRPHPSWPPASDPWFWNSETTRLPLYERKER